MFQHQVVSGLFWWAGLYLGWVGHFCVLHFLNSSRAGWGPEKRPFIGLCSTDPEKGPIAAPRAPPLPPPPQGPLGAVFYQALNHNAPSLSLQGPKHFELCSNILTLSCSHVCEHLLIFHRIVLSILYLMQYLIHVHVITNVCFTAHKRSYEYSWLVLKDTVFSRCCTTCRLS